ncbi:hypothetical protein WBJ53_04900 [Spirosoma sp. SC4-14]|uniref:hypothetical protein n=1 Tax=Spirosoma sp. SC4-14 TaxID=3128900 RepID=UPI0030D1B99C
MRFNLLRSTALVAVFWLNLECKPKENLACEDGSCCYTGQPIDYVMHIDSVRADYGAYRFFFKDSLQLPPPKEKLDWLLVCPNDLQATENLNLFNNLVFDQPNVPRFADSVRHYKYPYLIWGTVYAQRGVIVEGSSGSYNLHVERIVEIK